MLGRGLGFGQRICYLNAMLHFFFGLPRFVFLTAPLCYLMFRLNIIAASGLMVIVYAAPHLIHSTVTNSRLQSRYRHSFWGEIYESVLALYILRPTLATLINPRRGKFNVTEKGGLLPRDYFDYKIVRPHLIIMGLLIVALIIGVVRWILSDFVDSEVLMLNVAWAIFNLLTIAAAVAVGRETRQLRTSVRLGLEIPSVIYLPDGQSLVTRSRNLSTTGGMFEIARPSDIELGDVIQIELPVGDHTAVLPARVVAWDGEVLRVAFEQLTLRQQRDLVRVVLCRADAWLDWEDHPVDRPLRSVREVLSSIGGLFVRPAGRGRLRSVLLAVGVGLGALLIGGTAFAQTNAPPGSTPATSSAPPSAGVGQSGAGPLTGAAAPPPQGAQVPLPGPAEPGAIAPQSVAPSNNPSLPGPAGAGTPAAAAGAPNASTRTQTLTLKDLGANSPIRLIGVQGEGSLPFTVRRDEVVTGGKINLTFAYSPALIPELSHLTVLINGEVVGNIPLPKDKSSGDTAELPINPVLFQQDNRILFRFIGHYTLGCEDPLHSSLWLVLSNTTSISTQMQKLPIAPTEELSLLPAPFYDPERYRRG